MTWLDAVLPPDENGQHFLVPEVVQTSNMDCGPASLKALLEGFDIRVSYGRLREACQTSVDGTSIDTLEEVAQQLGLDARQIMVPGDHLFAATTGTLPALVVVTLPNGLAHFVIVWRKHGRLLQVMDPGAGRRWMTRERFFEQLYLHSQPFSAAEWRVWAGGAGFLRPLQERMESLGLSEEAIEPLLAAALEDPGWFPLAALDAATRMVDSMVRAGGVSSGDEARQLIARLFQMATEDPGRAVGRIIPPVYWFAVPDRSNPAAIVIRGAVLLRVHGRLAGVPPESLGAEGDEEEAAVSLPLPPELVAALEEPDARPEREVWRLLREDGLLTPAVLALALALATLGVTIEALLLRGLLDIGRRLNFVGQRIEIYGAILFFLGLLLLLELPMAATMLRIGRKLEMRLRVAFLEKIPHLGDRYFQSRLTSDMTQRVHELRQLRTLPSFGVGLLRLCFQLLLTAVAIIVFAPQSVFPALLATVFAIGMAAIAQPVMQEQDMRFRTHSGALSRFYLDGLLGLVPIRMHGAEQAMRHEHESLLVEWLRAGYAYFNAGTLLSALESVIGTTFAVWILVRYLNSGGEASGVLLLFYWTLSLPALGRSVAASLQQYPVLRNRLLRLLEPLGAPDESESNVDDAPPAGFADQRENYALNPGVTVDMHNLHVQAGGHTILRDIDLHLEGGEHIAVVGRSGAGKSSLVGLLLGWYWPATGHIYVDGQPLHGDQLHSLRRQTAWVDPAVQVWNRALLENLTYGIHENERPAIGRALTRANLYPVLEKLPNGLQTQLGEGGGLVSGGEGQRVRLGRAMLRPHPRLIILDEPFRGLDRPQRRKLLAEARDLWRDATLVFISHDVGDTQDFERVLVIDDGRIAEDDSPTALLQQPDSLYYALLSADNALRRQLWDSATWRRLWMEDGHLAESQAAAP